MNRLETLTVPVDLGVWLQYWELGQSGVYFSTIGSLYSYWETVAGSPTGDFISQNKKELIEVILGSRGYRVSRVNNLRKMTMSDVVPVDELQDLLVPKQELPVIPQYVADWIKEEQGTMSNWKLPSRFISDSKYKKDQRRYKWSQVEGNMDKFMSALINSYEVEEEPLYHALIKGHELTAVEGDWTRKYWNFDTSNSYVFPSNLFTKYGRYLTEMSKSEWNELGINDANADFVKVGVME